MNKYTDKTPDIKKLIREQCNSGDIFMISSAIFNDLPNFGIWSGSAKLEHHHYGDHGLSTHTFEVITLMLKTKEVLNLNIRPDHIILAGLFHDVGKMWDYSRKFRIPKTLDMMNPFDRGGWEGTDHKREIHHISRSGLVWSKAVDKYDLYKEHHDDILHAILAHHGRREWGSPVAPHTKLAWLLHTCDQISARMDDCDKCDVLDH